MGAVSIKPRVSSASTPLKPKPKATGITKPQPKQPSVSQQEIDNLTIEVRIKSVYMVIYVKQYRQCVTSMSSQTH